jgi:BASS family bile acid:Na+ symporter
VKGFARTAAILLAIVVGILFPQAHAASWLIRWLVMALLFQVFLQTRMSRDALHRSHFVLLAVNLMLGFAAWGMGWLIGGRDVALATFFCGIGPTAIAAPVIIGFLRGRVEYVVASFLLTNVVISALLPFILPWVLNRGGVDGFRQVLGTMVQLVFIPMLVARVVRAIHPAASQWPQRWRNFAFGLWVLALFLVTANASDFLRAQASLPHTVLAKIVTGSMLVCIASFGLGRLIGGKEFAREASQALGQKNTTFTIYLALTYASPLVALGPTCYVIWHNLWNSWQLHRVTHQHDD